jgi:hypothetical protein
VSNVVAGRIEASSIQQSVAGRPKVSLIQMGKVRREEK